MVRCDGSCHWIGTVQGLYLTRCHCDIKLGVSAPLVPVQRYAEPVGVQSYQKMWSFVLLQCFINRQEKFS